MRPGQRAPALHQATLGQAHAFRAADDDVVEHPHVDQCQRLFEARRHALIGLARLGVAARMLVTEDRAAAFSSGLA